ncbi:MAG: hypothetical protein IPM50_03025 [Acidobacteriota bacterium]|nr:MAG: hypothetical protein IPM50_03025 [Acidobacteriota bacterium]
MEILNGGSFITLDNREKIDQLIFTAQTLASEVHQNAGFQGSGQTNQQIGLELWKGAEYMTRSHEELTIRNIFLSKFLERLRDIERETIPRTSAPIQQATPRTIENTVANVASMSAELNTDVKTEFAESNDEFLGIVHPEESGSDRPSYANECKPECEEEIISILRPSEPFGIAEPTGDQSAEQNSIPRSDAGITTGEAQEHDSILSATGVEAVIETAPLMNSTDEAVPDDIIGTEQFVRSVVLSEKEPYNFDACTVTAVIQLLPESNGSRDCIVSVRSHEFAPQITFMNRCNESGEFNLSDPISTALEQYRNSLPLMAAEKMKKAQAATKKRSPNAAAKNPNNTSEQAVTSSDTTSTSSAIPQEPAKDQQSLFAS